MPYVCLVFFHLSMKLSFLIDNSIHNSLKKEATRWKSIHELSPYKPLPRAGHRENMNIRLNLSMRKRCEDITEDDEVARIVASFESADQIAMPKRLSSTGLFPLPLPFFPPAPVTAAPENGSWASLYTALKAGLWDQDYVLATDGRIKNHNRRVPSPGGRGLL